MKRIVPCVLLAVSLVLVFAPVVYAAASSGGRLDRSPGAPVAMAVSTLTGIAISPLLGTGALGAYKWFTAKTDVAREKLPWYAQPKFWVPALLIVLAVAVKDSMGATMPPGWKKPLDVLETIENKFSGLIAAGAVIPFALDAMGELLLKPDPTGLLVAPAASGLAMIGPAALDLSPLLNVLTIPFGVAVFAVVWLASHAINVLILLSPWGAIDAALKGARTALLGLITAAAAIDPIWGAVLSLLVVAFAFAIAGWAFRLTVFGAIFSWDFLTRRRTWFEPAGDGDRVFAGANFTGVPVRTYGQLRRRADGVDFVYRPWPATPARTVPVPVEARSIAVGQGLFFSNIIAADGRTLFLLPPRYRGHERTVASAYDLGGGVRDAGLRRAWSALREMLGVKALYRPPPTTVA